MTSQGDKTKLAHDAAGCKQTARFCIQHIDRPTERSKEGDKQFGESKSFRLEATYYVVKPHLTRCTSSHKTPIRSKSNSEGPSSAWVGDTFPNWTFCAQSWSSAVSQVLVPVSWEFLRTESYFPLTEGTKLHFSSTWTPHSVQCLQTRCVESREDSAMGVRTRIIRTMRGFRCNRRTVVVVF